MTGFENQGKPKTDVETVLAEFDAKEDMLAAFCGRTKSLIEASLQDANIRYQSVQFRVKSRKKVESKYLDPQKSYEKLADITDLAGLRIITYYEDDVDRVAEVVKREFRLDREHSIDKRETAPDRFGYDALNYVCEHHEKRTTDVEYKRFAGVCCEIQITSILRHAWAEIEHEWYDLKGAYPPPVKRRFYRIAALLELAESEFLDIRRSRTQYERSVAVRVEANVPDLAVDGVSLRAFIEQEALVAEIDRAIGAVIERRFLKDIPESILGLRVKAALFNGMTKLQDIRDSLKQYKTAIPEFVLRCKQEVWPPSPVTARLSRGVCIHHLGMVLASLRGPEAVIHYQKSIGIDKPSDAARLVCIAEEVAAKHSI
jgi:putative GTP pyrophosphokinase